MLNHHLTQTHQRSAVQWPVLKTSSTVPNSFVAVLKGRARLGIKRLTRTRQRQSTGDVTAAWEGLASLFRLLCAAGRIKILSGNVYCLKD